MNVQPMMRYKDLLCEEFEAISKKEVNPQNLEMAHKLTDTIKNIDKIIALEMEGEGYSGDGDWEARGSYGRGNGYSGRNMHYPRNHYSRDGESYNGNGNGNSNSYGGGNSYGGNSYPMGDYSMNRY